MADLALNGSDRFSIPTWLSSREIDAHEYAEREDPDSYSKRLLHLLQEASKPILFQQDLHITLGQYTPTHMNDFVFAIGTPQIALNWCAATEPSAWMDQVIQLCTTGKEDAALKEISLATSRAKTSENFVQLSDQLERFDLRKLPDVVLVALLRNTFSIRSWISCWNNLLDQTEEILQERKREPRSMLRGLKRYS